MPLIPVGVTDARIQSRNASLAQLAIDSGGRFSESTNDLTLAYARAQRDASCVYTLGVYVEEGVEDKVRSIAVNVTRPELRVLHPSKQVFRSDSRKRELRLQAAWIAPSMYDRGIVRAHVYPLQPVSRKKWDALLAISFPMPLGGNDGQAVERRFGAVLNEGSDIAREFNRMVSLEPVGEDSDAVPTVTFVERVELGPGDYTLTTVLADPKETRPEATRVNLTVPKIRRGEPFLVEPILGRPAGGNVVIEGGTDADGSAAESKIGSANSFEPLLVTQLPAGDDLVALSQVCLLGRGRKNDPRKVERRLMGGEGDEVGRLLPVPLRFAGKGKLHCQPLVDVLPASALRKGEYVFEASLGERDREAEDQTRLRFSITDLDAEGAATPAP
ncbi:hypothetical protein ABI59_10130 [Acidobacteria bacterium Mor1]|nr:hypothetical protein ABI59_10130 [Acidobacteria bacterium Mor1]